MLPYVASFDATLIGIWRRSQQKCHDKCLFLSDRLTQTMAAVAIAGMDVPEIKDRMAKLGWGAEQLARMSGLSLRTVQRTLSGEVDPRETTLRLIEQAIVEASEPGHEPTLTMSGASFTEVFDWFRRQPGEHQALIVADMLLSMDPRWKQDALARVQTLTNLRETIRREAEEKKRSGGPAKGLKPAG